MLVRPAKVIGIDTEKSSLRGGILLKTIIDGHEEAYSVALSMIEAVDKKSENAKWIEWAKWWWG